MPAEEAGSLAPIIVSARFMPAEQAWLDALRAAHFPPERNHLAAHLTLFHHLPPSLAAELKHRLDLATRQPPPPATVTGLRNLGRGTALAIEAPVLAAIRAALAEAFAGFLTPQDQAGWRPHVTLQNKVTPDAARTLRETLAPDFARPRALHVAALCAWWYRGGPWEPLSRHPFRG